MPTSSTCNFTSDRGHHLAARLERPDGPPRGAAVFAHCFTCSKDLRVERQLTRALTAQGFAVLSFDFAGLGSSGGDFTESSFTADVDDLRAAADYLSRTVAAPTLLVGHSLGGAAAISVAPDLPSVRAVVTIGSPSHPGHISRLFDGKVDEILREGQAEVELGGRTITIGRSFVEDLERHDPREQIARFDGATLILHSPIDESVGIEHAEMLYRAARHPKSFISLDTADHLLTKDADADYAAAVIAAWSGRYLDAGAAGTGGHQPEVDFSQEHTVATNAQGFATTLRARGFTMLADEPASVGGTESGPTPYDFLGMALGACTAMTLRMYAGRKKWPLDDIEVTVTHGEDYGTDSRDCDESDRAIHVLERSLRLVGDLDEDQRQSLARIADRCPVHRTLEGTIDVRTTMKLGTEGES